MTDAPPLPQNWTDRRAVGAWLRTQPREVSVALAARASLRVLPLVLHALGDNAPEQRRTIVLPLFLAVAVSWLAAVRPSQGTEMALRAVARAAAIFYVPPDALGLSRVVFAARDAAATAAFAFDASDQGAANAAAETIFVAADEGASAAFDADVGALASGYAAVAQAALWPEANTAWPEQEWSRLRDHLLATDEGWDVWTTWYEARLRGDPLDVELETRRVIEPTRWDEGPAAVNAEIAAIIADQRASLARRLVQDRRGALFVEREGRLAIAPGESGVDPRAAAMQPRTVEVLTRLAEATRNSNQFGALADTAARLADLVALPPDETARQSFLLWSLSGELAQWRTRDDAAAALGDGFVDAMPPNLRQALEAAVPATALYARSFDAVRAYDDELADHEGRVASTATQRAVLDAALAVDAIEKSDAATVKIVIELGSEDGVHARRASKGGWFTTRNMVAAAAGFAGVGLANGYLNEIGGGLARSHGATARFERFLDKAGTAIEDVMRDAPDDLRQAVEAVRAWIREKP